MLESLQPNPACVFSRTNDVLVHNPRLATSAGIESCPAKHHSVARAGAAGCCAGLAGSGEPWWTGPQDDAAPIRNVAPASATYSPHIASGSSVGGHGAATSRQTGTTQNRHAK
jgi:hypothetical protein